MVNLFYDIPTGTAFTPYIGGGLGLAIRQTKRQYSDHATCAGTSVGVVTNPFTGVTTTPAPGGCTGSATLDGSGSAQSTGYGWAGSAMAGVAYQIAPAVVFDVGYRYIWQDASATLTTTAVGGESTVKFDGRGDHEVRAAVRWFLE